MNVQLTIEHVAVNHDLAQFFLDVWNTPRLTSARLKGYNAILSFGKAANTVEFVGYKYTVLDVLSFTVLGVVFCQHSKDWKVIQLFLGFTVVLVQLFLDSSFSLEHGLFIRGSSLLSNFDNFLLVGHLPTLNTKLDEDEWVATDIVVISGIHFDCPNFVGATLVESEQCLLKHQFSP
ncbi:MAG: hypothetical protein [Caudoviricetes sp.]|nr:MAG: hypothetical protein [Caudoviricetes sp.]